MPKTGRFFKCLSFKGEESQQVQNYFEIGEIYAESQFDIVGENSCDETSLLLYSNKRFPIKDKNNDDAELSVMFYVSAMDFELIEHVATMHLN